RSWSPPGGGCTAAWSGTSASAATWTPRSRSVPRWSATASRTYRPAPASWPTRIRSPRTSSAATRRPPYSRRSPPPQTCARRDDPRHDRPGAMTQRRQFALAVAACVIGAALVLLATSRTWTVVVTERPAPLGPVRQARSGAALYPWLPALGLAALAG